MTRGKQHQRDPRDVCRHTLGLGGAKISDNQGHMRLTQWVKVMHRHIPRGTSQEQQSSGASLPGVCSNPTCLHTDQDHSKQTDLGALFHQPGRRPTTDRAVTATEQRGSSPQYLEQAQVTAIKCPSRGSGHRPQDQTEPLRGRHKKQEELGSCNLHGRNPKDRKCNETRGERVWSRGRGKIISYNNH